MRGKPVADLIPHRADATDLELAQRLSAALASFDRHLNQAAAAIGVALFAAPYASDDPSCIRCSQDLR